MTRPKSFLTYFVLCAIPLLLLAGLNYWNGLRSVNATLDTAVQDDLNSFNAAVSEIVDEQERAIMRLALNSEVQQLVTNKGGDLQAQTSLLDLSGYFQSLTLFDRDRQALPVRIANSRPANLPQPDQRVWGLNGSILVDKPGDSSSTVEYTTPIHGENGATNVGALVGVLDLHPVFAIAARGLESSKSAMIVVLDRSGKVVYHSEGTTNTGPEFESIANAMKANESGVGQFSAASGSYVAAYVPFPRLNVAVAVARSRSALISGAHRWGITGLVLAVLGAFVAAWLLERHVQKRTRGIARVSEDLSAIAKGELDRRIILQSSDDARGLADNINVVTERLRAQIEREEESRQFESFVRISAMLTHDLKNAIEALSLTVGNMERHFDNPQFRADAMKGLTGATDKLKALVARLGKPLTSLSGEHKRPQNVDLVPILQRVIAMTAEPMRGKHTIVTRLPSSLYALVDAARIEEVIENLVLNALEAMDKGGTLTIEAGQTPTGAPTFSVSDTGRGMTRTFIETRLFRPFATTKKTGIGLGLYTCREVIKASAGTIDVDSVEGAGTTFRVVLPSVPHERRN
ncbi:MAG TPA: ATP-binding protein [Pyrinomonadaceae bacterium]|nr:ATP-binding protein [Pyrinomonadaceae bacterium]